MTIIIPVEERSPHALVCPSFGRTPLFACIDTESGDLHFLDNAAAASQGGAGIKAAQLLVDSNADALITFRCGQNAAQVLSAANIALYKARPGNIDDNVKAFKNDSLTLLDEIHAGFHHHGGGGI